MTHTQVHARTRTTDFTTNTMLAAGRASVKRKSDQSTPSHRTRKAGVAPDNLQAVDDHAFDASVPAPERAEIKAAETNAHVAPAEAPFPFFPTVPANRVQLASIAAALAKRIDSGGVPRVTIEELIQTQGDSAKLAAAMIKTWSVPTVHMHQVLPSGREFVQRVVSPSVTHVPFIGFGQMPQT